MSRTLTGIVVSDQPDQTVVVSVERRVTHPIYRKAYTVTKKIHAHDPENSKQVGDTVTVAECPPRSALKRWEVVADSAEKTTGSKTAKPSKESTT